MRKDFKEFKKQALQKENVRLLYDDLKDEFELKNKLILLRKKEGLSQEQIAFKMNTTKSAISRLESMNSKTSPSLKSLKSYAKALNKKLFIDFV